MCAQGRALLLDRPARVASFGSARAARTERATCVGSGFPSLAPAIKSAAVRGAERGSSHDHFCQSPRMSRRQLLHLDGVPLHIVQRDRNREHCFFGEEDDLSHLYRLGEALRKERCTHHPYALMTNHVPLLIPPRQAEAVPRFIVASGRENRGGPEYQYVRQSSPYNPTCDCRKATGRPESGLSPPSLRLPTFREESTDEHYRETLRS